jgi:hypothetical protein
MLLVVFLGRSSNPVRYALSVSLFKSIGKFFSHLDEKYLKFSKSSKNQQFDTLFYMTDTTTRLLYGFVPNQVANAGTFTTATPFYKEEDGTTIYKADNGETAELQPGEDLYVWQPEGSNTGTLNDVVIIAGSDLIERLDTIGIKHPIDDWNNEGSFSWILASVEDYTAQAAKLKTAVTSWMHKTLSENEALNEEHILAAVELIHNLGVPSKEDYTLTGLAKKLSGDEMGLQLQARMVSAAFTDGLFSNVEEYLNSVSALETTLH